MKGQSLGLRQASIGDMVKSRGHFSCSQPEGRTSQFKHLWVLEEKAFGSQSHSRIQGSSPVLLEKKFRAMVSKKTRQGSTQSFPSVSIRGKGMTESGSAAELLKQVTDKQ